MSKRNLDSLRHFQPRVDRPLGWLGGARGRDRPTSTARSARCATASDGKGNTVMGKKLVIKDLTDQAVMSKLTDQQIEDQIRTA